MALEYPNGGRQWIVSRGASDVPLPTDFGFSLIEPRFSQFPFSTAWEVASLRLVTERAVSHMEPGFDFSIRIDDYAHGTGMLTR